MKRNAVLSAVVLLGIMILIGTQAIAVAQRDQPKDVRYTVTQVGVPPGYEHSFLPAFGSINNRGFVAGYAYNGPLDTNSIDFLLTSSAFIGDPRRPTLLPTPAGYAGALADGLNDNNQAFGPAYKLDDAGNLLQSTVVWDQHRNPTLLEHLPDSPYYSANAMNNNGDVVGYVYLPPDYLTAPVYWHRGKIARLPLPGGAADGYAVAINDLGVIVGTVDYGTPPEGTGKSHLYAWIPRSGHYVGVDLGDKPGNEVWPQAINNLGQIAVGAWDGALWHAFVWTFGHMKDLGLLPGGSQNYPWAINNWGQVVGQGDRSDGNWVAFLWQDDTIIDLNDVVPSEYATPPLEHTGGINDVGQIAVTSWSPDGSSRSFILTPISRHSH